jgi:hypothetical protein
VSTAAVSSGVNAALFVPLVPPAHQAHGVADPQAVFKMRRDADGEHAGDRLHAHCKQERDDRRSVERGGWRDREGSD